MSPAPSRTGRISGERRAAHGRDTLQALAKATGGLVVNGTAADLSIQFARIRDDLAAPYVLGFMPAASVGRQAHKLKIGVASPGAKIRHRLGHETGRPR